MEYGISTTTRARLLQSKRDHLVEMGVLLCVFFFFLFKRGGNNGNGLGVLVWSGRRDCWQWDSMEGSGISITEWIFNINESNVFVL
jgi:hypothetical protein